MAEEGGADFAVVAYREEGHWEVSAIPPRAAADLTALRAVLRQQGTEGEAIAFVSYDDDFFVVVRQHGDGMRLLLSDATAGADSVVARQVLDELHLPIPEGEEELEAIAPAGDLSIFADLGLGPMDLTAICGDLDLYPDEMLGSIAARLGFGDQFDRAVDAAAR